MNETITISSTTMAEHLDKYQLTNYNLSETSGTFEATGAPLDYPITMDDEESEDEADIAIARLALEEIKKDPSSVLRGEELREALAALEGSESVERK